MTEEEFINYLYKNKVSYDSCGEYFIPAIPDKDVDNWIVSRINNLLRLEYLRRVSNGNITNKWDKVPQLKKLSGIYLIPGNRSDINSRSKIKLLVPALDEVRIDIHALVNIEEIFHQTIDKIRKEKNDKIDSLMIELGRETTAIEEIEKNIKTWWPEYDDRN